MKLFDKFEIIEPYPALWIEEEKAVVIADLHLGLETLLASKGVYFPKFQWEEMKEDLKEIFKQYPAKRIIINGDIKHDFAKSSYKEKQEVKKLLNFLTLQVDEIKLIKGNHDNYLIYSVKEFENTSLEDKVCFNDVCFIHGDEEKLDVEEKYVIAGHEHPAIVLTDELGVEEKVRCFLYGDYQGKKVIVMPAFSKLAEGSQVNEIPKHELLSPWLQKEGVGNLKAVGVSEEAGLLEFPEIKKL